MKKWGGFFVGFLAILLSAQLAFGAWPSDLVRTKDWGTETLTDADLEGQLDLIINWVMATSDSSTGHAHEGTSNKSPKISTVGINNDAITFALIDDDGDFGPFTGDWSFNEIALVEDTAPTTAASEGKIYTKDTGGQPEMFFREESDGDEVQITNGGILTRNAGSIVQVVNVNEGTLTQATTLMPSDDSIPQNTEGDEIFTLAITPTSASNKLLIRVVMQVGSEQAGVNVGVALFQDATAGALAASAVKPPGTDDLSTIVIEHYMAAGTASETTFKVRVGSDNDTFNVNVNGSANARWFGGVCISSMTITEIKV